MTKSKKRFLLEKDLEKPGIYEYLGIGIEPPVLKIENERILRVF